MRGVSKELAARGFLGVLELYEERFATLVVNELPQPRVPAFLPAFCGYGTDTKNPIGGKLVSPKGFEPLTP